MKITDRLRQARDQGCAYLLRQQRDDGSVGPPERGLADYYKVPLAYQVCGASSAASRLFQWIRKRGITIEGDFGPRPDEARDYFYIYYNSWIIIGAQRQGQFDLSQKGMNFLLKFRNPETGGFFSSISRRAADTKEDLWVVSGAGQAALYTGRLDVSRDVGGWMKRLMELQPNYPDQLYGTYSQAAGLHTTFEPGDEIRYLLSREATRDQYFFNPGIAAGFLVNLYKATGESEWVDLAREYMRLAEGASDYLLRSLRAGKVGWAAALLFTLTGEKKYQKIAARVGENLIAAQNSDGQWMFDSDLTINDLTAEMVVWLDEIAQALDSASASSAE